MSSFNKIRSALEVHATSIPGFPAVQDRQWENRKYVPEIGKAWTRIGVELIDRQKAANGSNSEWFYFGNLYIDLFHPEYVGVDILTTLVDNIMTHFTPNTPIVRDGVRVRPRRTIPTKGYNNDGWYIVPVTITWHCYAP